MYWTGMQLKKRVAFTVNFLPFPELKRNRRFFSQCTTDWGSHDGVGRFTSPTSRVESLKPWLRTTRGTRSEKYIFPTYIMDLLDHLLVIVSRGRGCRPPRRRINDVKSDKVPYFDCSNKTSHMLFRRASVAYARTMSHVELIWYEQEKGIYISSLIDAHTPGTYVTVNIHSLHRHRYKSPNNEKFLFGPTDFRDLMILDGVCYVDRSI